MPAVVLESGADGVAGPSASGDLDMFPALREHRVLPGIGHDVPQEAPEAFAAAVAALLPSVP